MENMTIEVYTNGSLGPMTQVDYIILLESCYIVWSVISSAGVLSNVINIKVFVTMGVQDGFMVSFLALAIFDLTYLVLSLPFSVSVVFYVYEIKLLAAKFHIDPFAISIFIGHVMIIINITNVLATTFLAVVRCLCVAKPLQFKNTITKKVATLFMAGITVFSVTIYIPILANMGIINKFDKFMNTSRPSLWISPSRDTVKKIVWVVVDMFVPIVTEFVILFCVVIMVRCLRAASKFRQSSGNIAKEGKDSNKRYCSQSQEIVVTNSNSSGTDKLTGKDLRVVQQVVLISVVYIVCNVPKIMISFCSVIETEFTVGKRYSNIYLSVNCLRKHFEIVNAAVNFIIYYKYNRKFRLALHM